LAPRWEVRLAEAAERDFRAILAWTAEQFGSTQARRYRDVLVSALTSLTDGPTPLNWKARDDIAPGLRSLHVGRRGRRGRHILFFRQGADNVVEVLRILHDVMDAARHLPP
jgi:toxin ParE1/3/4